MDLLFDLRPDLIGSFLEFVDGSIFSAIVDVVLSSSGNDPILDT